MLLLSYSFRQKKKEKKITNEEKHPQLNYKTIKTMPPLTHTSMYLCMYVCIYVHNCPLLEDAKAGKV